MTAAIRAALAELQDERRAVGARLDAIDLAIENLRRAYGLADTAPPAKRGKLGRRRRAAAKAADWQEHVGPLLQLIAKSDVGLTLGELRKATPRIAGKGRSRALQALKSDAKIKRAGNAWKAA